MTNRVQHIYDLTKDIVSLLNNHEIEREQMISELTELLQKREQLLENLKSPYTEAEQNIGEEIVELNKTIDTKVEQLFTDIKSDLNKVKQKKSLNLSYINPYGNIKTTDGMYLDSKQ